MFVYMVPLAVPKVKRRRAPPGGRVFHPDFSVMGQFEKPKPFPGLYLPAGSTSAVWATRPSGSAWGLSGINIATRWRSWFRAGPLGHGTASVSERPEGVVIC